MVLQCFARRNWVVLSSLQRRYFSSAALSANSMTIGGESCQAAGPTGSGYEDAIKALNNLPSNAASIRKTISTQTNQKIADMVKYLKRSGLTLEQLDRLSVIHVSGTKGKGSTCAMTESILRAHNVKTGFFSSPHLVLVTERFRINGYPICKEKFSKYFWRVYDRIQATRENDHDMPPYFNFLTVLSFHIFLEENVDVALLEVGIGGEYDCTNVVRNTKTVGITSLGLEHTAILGNTLQEIAWQKSGIIKPGANVYTSATQPECLEVISERTREQNATLYHVPDISAYNWPKVDNSFHLNRVQKFNASLAIQLANDWMVQNGIKKGADEMDVDVSEAVVKGLNDCSWPGRCQVLKLDKLNIYLDGAHTVESINLCRDWFSSITKNSETPKVLIFNTTGDRNSAALLQILTTQLDFKVACFVPNIPFQNDSNSDTNDFRVTSSSQLQRAHENEIEWKRISGNQSSKVLPSVLDALTFVEGKFKEGESVDVLITGSLYLVGASILAMEEFNKRAQEIIH